MSIRITQAQPSDAPVVAELVGELLHEIMAAIGTQAFEFSQSDTEERARRWTLDETYIVLLAHDQDSVVGFLTLTEYRALYAEGAFGIIPEFVCTPGLSVSHSRCDASGGGETGSPVEGLDQIRGHYAALAAVRSDSRVLRAAGIQHVRRAEDESRTAMKPVVQEERTGCGIAAVAAIAGVSYAKAKTVAASLGISSQDRRLWSETIHVRRLLALFGVHAARTTRPFRAWSKLPDCALLAIKWRLEKERPFWHWVVFVRAKDQAYVLDSKPTLKTAPAD